jgi:hypothetical protein
LRPVDLLDISDLEETMGSPYKDYAKQLYKQFRYFANWLPGEPRALGDIGVLKYGFLFQRITTLQELGNAFSTRQDITSDTLRYTSKSGVAFHFKAQGTAPAVGSTLSEAEAGITIDFSNEGALVLRASGVTHDSIEDMQTVSDALAASSRWREDLFVITHLTTANVLTALLSSSSSGRIELTAQGSVPSVRDEDLAKLGVDLSIAYSRDMETEIVCQEGLNPLFNVSFLDQGVLTPQQWGGILGLRPPQSKVERALLRSAAPAFDDE